MNTRRPASKHKVSIEVISTVSRSGWVTCFGSLLEYMYHQQDGKTENLLIVLQFAIKSV